MPCKFSARTSRRIKREEIEQEQTERTERLESLTRNADFSRQNLALWGKCHQ